MLLVKTLPKAKNLLWCHPETPENLEALDHAPTECLPPELCQLAPAMWAPVWRALVRAPSVGRRIEGLLLAGELKGRMGGRALRVPSPRVMEALTGGGSGEGFSYERYEIVGDAYLKYAVARYGFLARGDALEGQLSLSLSARVCNRQLSSLSWAVGLPRYSSTAPLDPATWRVPEAPPGDVNLLADPQVARYSQVASRKTSADLAEAMIGLMILEDASEDCALECLSFLGMEEGGLGVEEGGRTLTENTSRYIADRASSGAGDEKETRFIEPWKQALQAKRDVASGGNERTMLEIMSRFALSAWEEEDERTLTRIASTFGRESLAFWASAVLERTKRDATCQPVLSPDQESVQEVIRYSFRDSWLLANALHHPTAELEGGQGPCHLATFERLEFLGDAVLDFLLTRHLATAHPDLDPGRISIIKQLVASNEWYARASLRTFLHRHLSVGSAPLAHRIALFATAVLPQGEQSEPGQEVDQGGFSEIPESAPKALADAFEALAGALLLDSGMDPEVVWKILRPFLEPLPDPETARRHPLCQLSEMCAKQGWNLQLEATEEKALETFRLRVWVNGQLAAVEVNENLQTARRIASSAALRNLSSSGDPITEVQNQGTGIQTETETEMETEMETETGTEKETETEMWSDSLQSERSLSKNLLPEKEIRYMQGKGGKFRYWRNKPPAENVPLSSSNFPEPSCQLGGSRPPLSTLSLEERFSSKGAARKVLEGLRFNLKLKPVDFSLVERAGLDHDPLFRFRAMLAVQSGTVVMGEGKPGCSHAEAKDNAALELLKKLDSLDPEISRVLALCAARL